MTSSDRLKEGYLSFLEKGDSKAEFKVIPAILKEPQLQYRKLLLTFTDKRDKLLIFLGTFFAMKCDCKACRDHGVDCRFLIRGDKLLMDVS